MALGIERSTAGARPARIPRIALAQRLRAALDTGHLLMVAPAGYGKTTALDEALAGPDADGVARVRCGARRAPGGLVVALADAR